MQKSLCENPTFEYREDWVEKYITFAYFPIRNVRITKWSPQPYTYCEKKYFLGCFIFHSGSHCAFWPPILNVKVPCICMGWLIRCPLFGGWKMEGWKMLEVELVQRREELTLHPPFAFASPVPICTPTTLNIYGSVSGGREKWLFYVYFFLKTIWKTIDTNGWDLQNHWKNHWNQWFTCKKTIEKRLTPMVHM